MKITIISEDLSSNHTNRAYDLARVLQRRYEVTVIGPIFQQEIYRQCVDGKVDFKGVKTGNYPNFLLGAAKLLKLFKGDVIIAPKLMPTSFGVGLLQKLISRTPLILDMSDWALALFTQNWRNQSKKELVLNPNSYLYVSLFEKLHKYADDVIATSRFLQKRYGGVIVRDGVDTKLFDPHIYDRDFLRKKYGFNRYKIAIFCGKPSIHTDFEGILKAIALVGDENIKLAIVGATEDNRIVKHLMKTAPDKLIIEGQHPYHEIPKYLAAADFVLLPGRKSPFAEAYMPAKLYDAMAMAKPIISTSTSDIPEALEGCGIVVDPGDIKAIAKGIKEIINNPDRAGAMGKRARVKCIEKFSWDAMERTLVQVIERYSH